MKKTCSKKFRDIVFEVYPGLYRNVAFERHMRRLLFSGGYNRDVQGNIKISWKQIAVDEGEDVEDYDSHYRAEQFLEKFRDRVMPNYKWTDYSFKEKRCRRAIVDFPQTILNALHNELTGQWDGDTRVYFVGGQKWSRQKQKKEIEQAISKANTVLEVFDSAEGREIMDYLNSLPINRFNKILDNLNDAREAVVRLDKPRAVESQLRVLDAIKDQPKPIYAPTQQQNTVRLFSDAESLQGLKGNIRRILTKDWYECDLMNAQLAIVATLWDIPSIKQYLEKGESIWKDLVPYVAGYQVSPGQYEDIKSIVKDYTYGIVFGIGIDRLKREMRERLDECAAWDGVKRFLKHWIIADLLAARARIIKELKLLKIADVGTGKLVEISDTNVRSFLSQQAQAVEMQLIYPIFELAKDNPEFDITLYQFDGLCICFRDTKRAELWKNRIENAVLAKAQELKVLTKLEWKN